ncbi:MAG: phosphate ABC transporter permease subunit PstC [Anaerolineae bacterium]
MSPTLDSVPPGGVHAPSRPMTKRLRPTETIMRIVLLTCGVVSIATTIGIVVVLGLESLAFFREVSITDFLFGTSWQPRLGQFGIWPLLTATLMTTVFALFVSVPLGLAAAIYLSEYAPARTRATLKPVLELLAGIPTVVYGYFALTFMTPLLQAIFGPQVQVYNTLSAGLVMGIMILPTVASMSEDALNAVPRALREASYGLGATKFETVAKVVVPAAFSGLVAAFLIGMARAIGETMIVALAAGAGPNMTLNPFEPAQTITGYIASISGGDIAYDSLDYLSIFALGLFLFVFTLILNLISQWISRRFREVYQ